MRHAPTDVLRLVSVLVLLLAACGPPETGSDPNGQDTGNGLPGNGSGNGTEDENGDEDEDEDENEHENGNEDEHDDENGTGNGSDDEDDETDSYAHRPLGQCTVNADCPEGPQGRDCNRLAPGGICLACGSDLHCPVETTCNQFGACSHTCTSGDDCPPGMRCAGNGLCALKPCVQGACPVPFLGCNASNFCNRIPCPEGDECPDGATCLDGVCIEDRVLGAGD